MEKLVSIVIPCYNAASTLSRTLNSVLEQDYKNLEIILVNDGSRDATLEIANEYAKQDRRFQVLNQLNSGVSVARNNGMDHAHGEYLMFLDADDNYTTPIAISKMVKILEDQEADQVICNFTHPCFEQYIKDKVFDLTDRESFLTLYQDFFLHGVPWNKITKRKCFTEKFIPGVKFEEDALFSVANFHNMKKVVTTSEVLYNYYCAPQIPSEKPSAINSMYVGKAFWDNPQTVWFKGKSNQPFFEKYFEKFYQGMDTDIRYTRSFDFLFFDMFVMFKNDLKTETIAFVVNKVFEDQFFKETLKDKERYGLTLKRYRKSDVYRFVDLCNIAFKDIRGYNKNLSTLKVCISIFALIFYNMGHQADTIDLLARTYKEFREQSTPEARYVKMLIAENAHKESSKNKCLKIG